MWYQECVTKVIIEEMLIYKSNQRIVRMVALGLSALVTGTSQAVTVSDFDELTKDEKGKVVSEVVMNNIKQLVQYNQNGLASCMISLFQNVENEDGKVINVGLGTVSKQINISRQKDPDNRHVEEIVERVFDYFLENECKPRLEEKPQ